MSSESKEKSPQITFQPPKKNITSFDLDTLKPIHLPGIATLVEKIKNVEPNIVSETAVIMSAEHQQYVSYAINMINPSLISGVKSHAKSPIQYYTAKYLKEIAKNIGLTVTESKKSILAPLILERVTQLRMEGESQTQK